MDKTTLDEIYWPLMDAPSINTDFCVVCGRRFPINRHHVVRKSAGKLYRNGREVPKPTLSLCGFGNALGSDGTHLYCHGLAHHNMLHFRFDRGRYEFIVTDEPTRYTKALELDGWKPLILNRGF